MSKPTSIRSMLLILYFQLAWFVVGVALLLGSVPEDGDNASAWSFLLPYFAVTVLAMIGTIWMINRRKMFPAMISAVVLLFCSVLANQLQLMLSMVTLLLFVLRSTREYFRGTYEPPAPAGSRKAAPVAAEDGEEAAQAALAEPEDAPREPLSKLKKDPEITIREATPDDADTVFALMMMAYEEYRKAIPPSSALSETDESVLHALRSGEESAAILYEDDTAVAMVRFKYEDEAIHFFRLSVVPHRRRRGYAKQLVKWIEKQGVAKGMKISRCRVRQSVQRNLTFYQDMGYEIVNSELFVRAEGTVKALTLELKLYH
ncbi:GNAT family N-acetyltransferase [Paenibacillaceae bacterium WGS1546]|uniref:GNAT family N-acetyltransferase n=1 Tax=Cohnella sp. WGS1546 TaxID=3366810 RepID=UPI00372D47EC